MTDLEARFWQKVDKNGPVPPHRPELGPCWIWTGCLHWKIGYGRLFPRYLTHRLSWEFNVGPIPNGMCVLHHCDVRPCVRPDHLFLGTKGDNNRDRAAKDRGFRPRGGLSGTAKLTEAQVVEIRTLAGVVPQRKIAAQFGISQQHVSDIVTGKRWAHAV